MDSIGDILARTRTITFDCYGTLIDWDAGLSRAFVEIFGPEAAAHRKELFDAHVGVEAEIESGPFRSYREVLATVVERLAYRFKWNLLPGKRGRLAELLPSWTPFADTNDALLRLKKRYRLGVLSNTDRDLFAGTAKHFPIQFDFLVTAQDVRSYKPALPHFERFLGKHGGRGGWLHVAQSQFHDGRPANQVGIAFVWINRYKDPADPMVRAAAEYPDLKSLADAAER